MSYLKMESYPGGKTADGTYQTIINQIPPHEEFISGYLGHCAITRIKAPAGITYGIETNPDTVHNWEALNVAHPEHPLLDRMVIRTGKFLEQVKRLPWDCFLNPFIYLDPPYPRDTRRTQRDIYQCEMDQADHTELLRWCIAQKVPICISSYPNDLYEEMLTGWRCITFEAQTRGGPATEIIYMNYEEPTELHDYRFIGADYRQREVFKRRNTSFIRKFDRLTEKEKYLVFGIIESRIALMRESTGSGTGIIGGKSGRPAVPQQ